MSPELAQQAYSKMCSGHQLPHQYCWNHYCTDYCWQHYYLYLLTYYKATPLKSLWQPQFFEKGLADYHLIVLDYRYNYNFE